MSRIIIELTRNEMDALKQNAKQNLRHPRDQARFLLRNLLLKTNSQVPNKNSDGSTFAEQPVATV